MLSRMIRRLRAATQQPDEREDERVTAPNAEENTRESTNHGKAISVAGYIEALCPETQSDHEESFARTDHVTFVRYITTHWTEGADALERREFGQIVRIWAPVNKSPFFDLRHPEWRDKAYFRAIVRSGVCQLFLAHMTLGQEAEYDVHVPEAVRWLSQALDSEPFLLSVGKDTTLSAAEAAAQDANYFTTLEAALWWFQGWSPSTISTFFDVPLAEAAAAEERTRERVAQVRQLLQNA